MYKLDPVALPVITAGISGIDYMMALLGCKCHHKWRQRQNLASNIKHVPIIIVIQEYYRHDLCPYYH